jgi:hypothetical protein
MDLRRIGSAGHPGSVFRGGRSTDQILEELEELEEEEEEGD